MAFPFAALLGTLGSAIGGFFGMKKEQGKVVSDAVSTIGDVTKADSERAQASADAIVAVYKYGGAYERAMRPTIGYIFTGLIVARWFGFTPVDLPEAEVAHLYQVLYIVLSGYIAARSLDKWMMGFQIGSVLKTFIEKKLV